MSAGILSSPQPVSPPQPSAAGAPSAFLPDEPRPSCQSRLLNAVLKLKGAKRPLASAAAVQADVRRLAARPASHAPTGLGRGIEVDRWEAAGWPVYHLGAPGTHTGDTVVFLHGGGFLHEMARAHWRFVAGLIRGAGVRVIVPIYPLIPHATAKEVVPAMGELLRGLVGDAGAGRLTVLGNSAGAGLGLAAAQWLRDGGYRQPAGLILVSPGVDFAPTGPEHAEIAPHDPVLDIPGTLELGRLWAGDLEVAHPYVSPLHGDFRGLAPMLVISGTADLLYPDSIELATKARAAGVPVDLHVRRGQPHNYAAMPTPEGRQARELILRALSR